VCAIANSVQVRREVVGRYEYTLYCKNKQYYVACQDSEVKVNGLVFGPFPLGQANDMIDSRRQRHEELKRD